MNRLTHARFVEIETEHADSRPAFIREADGNDWHRGASVCTCGDTFIGTHAEHRADILMAALADHDRAVGAEAWAEGHRAGFASGDSGYVAGTNQRLVRSTNPYRDQETP